jgi:hypothetical protein
MKKSASADLLSFVSLLVTSTAAVAIVFAFVYTDVFFYWQLHSDCWDLNRNGECDKTEDYTDDHVCNYHDCIRLQDIIAGVRDNQSAVGPLANNSNVASNTMNTSFTRIHTAVNVLEQALPPVATPGAPGAKGDKGDIGAVGSVGPTGVDGDTGTAGATGATGSTGPIGPTGPTGPAGAKGTRGATGASDGSLTSIASAYTFFDDFVDTVNWRQVPAYTFYRFTASGCDTTASRTLVTAGNGFGFLPFRLTSGTANRYCTLSGRQYANLQFGYGTVTITTRVQFTQVANSGVVLDTGFGFTSTSDSAYHQSGVRYHITFYAAASPNFQVISSAGTTVTSITVAINTWYKLQISVYADFSATVSIDGVIQDTMNAATGATVFGNGSGTPGRTLSWMMQSYVVNTGTLGTAPIVWWDYLKIQFTPSSSRP